MIRPEEWLFLSKKLVRRPKQAPAFLATRVLAVIDEREAQASWWGQAQWMSRLTIVTSLIAGLASAYFLTQTASVPLDALLHGQPGAHVAIQVATTRWTSPGRTAAYILEEEPWEVD